MTPEYENDPEKRNDLASKIGKLIGSVLVLCLLLGMTLVFAGVRL